MAIYKDRNDSLFLDELHLYGSSRLGVIKANEWLPKKDDNLTNVPPVTLKASPYTLKLYNFGKKRYELADWLGNVRVVINDKKTPMGTNPSDMTYAAQTISVSDYYPFGMLSRSYNIDKYRFGFNRKENDDEIIGAGRWQDYGVRMYRPDLGRFFSPDPLQTKIPSWAPYTYTLDNPIMFVDENGKWPGVTYMFFELDVGLGLSYGLNYIEQSGIAFDEVGKTHFTMTSALYIVNQNFEESSINPEIVSGISASLSGGITQDWSNETFLGDILGYNGEFGGIEAGEVLNVGIGFGRDRFSLKLGLGLGVKISVINTQIKQSISLTDEEAQIVNDATDVISESWIVNNIRYDSENNKWTGTVATRNTKGELIDTGIQISSANIVDKKGNNVPSGIWTSEAYQTESAKAEDEN